MDFEARRTLLREYCAECERRNKHTLVHQIVEIGEYDEGILKKYLQKVRNCESECDFVIIILIRILFLLSRKVSTQIENGNTYFHDVTEMITSCLRDFPFWPPKYCDLKSKHSLDDLVFWSENHLFMTLGSAYLFFQFQSELGQCGNDWMEVIECQLLDRYLDIHCSAVFAGGAYEVNSHVYLPYSISALLNLYDFAKDERVREKAGLIIDRIVYQLMLGTDPLLGVATFTASARAFARTRLRVFDHNINQLVNLLNQGISPNPHSVTALTDFLLTTNWVPKAEALQALHFDGFIHNIRMSHDLDDLPFLYSQPFENSSNVIDEFTPLYWSAGLITHPQMAEKTRNYQSKKALTKNKHLWPLSYFFFSDVSFASSMQQYEHFSKGQVYTGIKLNVYKRPTYGLVFSSFELYNPHYCGFQQFPWIANLRGVPIWSQSGLGSESISGFGIHNTHNPAIQQIQDIMLITYLAPDALSGLFVRNLFSSHVRFFWPIPLFDKHIVKEYSKQSNEDNAKVREKKKIFPSFSFKGNGKAQMIKKSPILPSNEDESIMKSDKHKVWCIGQRESLFVAVLCTKGVYLDYKDTNDARFTYRVDDSSVTVTIPRLICEAKRHSWIVVVGTIMEYPDIDAFIDSKLSHITVQEEIKDGVSYDILIVDGERQLRYSYDLRRREQILQSNTKV